MLGAILGDIIGSIYEWHNVKTEDFPLFCYGSHFTDDSVLSVAVADKLLSYIEEKTLFSQKNNSSKKEIKAFIQKNIGYSLNFTLQQIRPSYTFNSRANYTVPPAIIAFLESDSYESAVRKAISIGGDSDTIACMTGAIAEAYYKIIPKELENKGYSILDSGLLTTIRKFYQKFF